MDAFRIWGIVTLVIFLLVSIFIGWISLRRVKDTSDFIIAKRQMGPWSVAFTFGAAAFSSSLFVGSAAMGYMWGTGIFWVCALFLLIGTITTWLVLGKRLRRVSIRLGALTFSDLLAKRYQAPILQPIAGIIVLLAMQLYAAAILMGTGFLFEIFFNIPYAWGVVIMLVVVGFYLAAGGVVSTMWNSVFQALVMITGVVVFVSVFYMNVGFASAFESLAATRGPGYVSFPGVGGMAAVAPVLYFSLFTFAMPPTLHQFITMKSPDVIRKALPIVVIWSFVMLFGLYYIFALSYPVLGPDVYPDKVTPMLMVKMLSAPLAAWLMVSILAASMSTVASQTLQGAFAILKDIYQARFQPDISDLMIMRMARLLCVLLAVVALLLALPKLDLIIWVVGLSMAVCIGSFMAQMTLGLHWRRATGTAAIWAMFLGFAATIAWAVLFGIKGENLYYIHPTIPGMAVNWIIFIVVSLLSKPLPREHLELVFGTGN